MIGNGEGLDTAKTRIKLFILFLLNEINYPLDYDMLGEVITESGYVGYFDFAELFLELCDLGHIVYFEKNGVRYYRISDTGRMVANELQDELSEAIRAKSRRTAMRILSLRSRGAVPSFSKTLRADGKTEVKVKLTDACGVMAEATVAVGTDYEAEKIHRFFDKNPEIVYRGIYYLLTGDLDNLLH